jgi:hypothetical protein
MWGCGVSLGSIRIWGANYLAAYIGVPFFWIRYGRPARPPNIRAPQSSCPTIVVPQNRRAPQSSCPTIGGADPSEIAFRTLHIVAMFQHLLHPSLPPLNSAARHPSFRRSSASTPPPITPALHCAALYPSFCRSLPFNPPPFTPPPPPYTPPHLTPPPLTPPPLAPPVACHDLCDFRIVKLNLG